MAGTRDDKMSVLSLDGSSTDFADVWKQDGNNPVLEAIYEGRWAELASLLESLRPESTMQLLLSVSSLAADRYGRSHSLQQIAVTEGRPQGLPICPLLHLMIREQRQLIVQTVQQIASTTQLSPIAANRSGLVLFQLVDFCRCFPDKEQSMAELFETLAAEQPEFWAPLLTTEATREAVTPLEYAAIWSCFQLARAFMEAPGYLRESNVSQDDPNLVVDRYDLSRYRWLTGDRFALSPIVQLGCATMKVLGENIPDGFVAFYECPAVQKYIHQVANKGVMSSSSTIPTILFYLIYYPLFLATFTARLFTDGQFQVNALLKVQGQANTSVSYLRELPQPIFTALQYAFYLRLPLQTLFIVVPSLFIMVSFLANRCLPEPSRRSWLPMHWLRSALTFSYDIREGSALFYVIHQLFVLSIEFQLFHSNYVVIDGERSVHLGVLRLSLFLHTMFLTMILTFLIDGLSNHHKIFFYLIFSMQASLKVLYVIVAPVAMLSIALAICYPVSDTTGTLEPLERVINLLTATWRYIFGMVDMPGAVNYLVNWTQPMFYVLVSLFLVNFCIALLTQRIAIVDQHTELRQKMRIVDMNHRGVLALKWLVERFGHRWKPKKLVLEHARLRGF